MLAEEGKSIGLLIAATSLLWYIDKGSAISDCVRQPEISDCLYHYHFTASVIVQSLWQFIMHNDRARGTKVINAIIAITIDREET